MITKLRSLVQADPILMEYALEHLGEGIDLDPRNPFYCKAIHNLRQEILGDYGAALWGQRTLGQLTTAQLNQLEYQWTEQLLRESSLRRLLGDIHKEDRDAIRQRLTDPRAIVRLVAVQAIADRRLHLQDELIERLGDRSGNVSQAARRALVRLARGTDFGPPPKASKLARAKAVARWQSWLALQRLAANGSSSAAVDFQTAVDGVLGKTTHTLAAADPEIVRLRDELIRADGDAQDEVLTRLKDAKGVVHTEAIAQAIPHLPTAVQAKARAALVERLTRMTAKTPRDKFGQDEAEVRQAAARACAAKGARELVPELIALLDDPEPGVVREAHTALKELTHQDFGPPTATTPAEHAKALAAWKDWWRQQPAQQ